jgi:hypothetical protein
MQAAAAPGVHRSRAPRFRTAPLTAIRFACRSSRSAARDGAVRTTSAASSATATLSAPRRVRSATPEFAASARRPRTVPQSGHAVRRAARPFPKADPISALPRTIRAASLAEGHRRDRSALVLHAQPALSPAEVARAARRTAEHVERVLATRKPRSRSPRCAASISTARGDFHRVCRSERARPRNLGRRRRF